MPSSARRRSTRARSRHPRARKASFDTSAARAASSGESSAGQMNSHSPGEYLAPQSNSSLPWGRSSTRGKASTPVPPSSRAQVSSLPGMNFSMRRLPNPSSTSRAREASSPVSLTRKTPTLEPSPRGFTTRGKPSSAPTPSRNAFRSSPRWVRHSGTGRPLAESSRWVSCLSMARAQAKGPEPT